MKNLTFSNKNDSINATINDGAIVFDNGNTYHINARYGASGITGAYITADGKTYSLKDFASVASDITAYIEAQPKAERKKSDGGQVKRGNLVKLASASDDRLAYILCEGFSKACEKCKEYGASIEAIERAQNIAIEALRDGEKHKALNDNVLWEVAQEQAREQAEKEEKERKAQASAHERIITGIMTAYKVNRATAEAMAEALARVNVELPQA